MTEPQPEDGTMPVVKLTKDTRLGIRRQIDTHARKRVRCNFCGRAECDCRNVNKTPLVVSSMERGRAKSSRRWTNEELLRAIDEVAAVAAEQNPNADPRSRKSYDLYRTKDHPTSHTIIARFGSMPKEEANAK